MEITDKLQITDPVVFDTEGIEFVEIPDDCSQLVLDGVMCSLVSVVPVGEFSIHQLVELYSHLCAVQTARDIGRISGNRIMGVGV